MIYVNGKPVAGFGSGKSRQFSVSLPASGWIENEQIVSNNLFKSSGYAYLANPDSDSYLAWVSSQVRPEDEVAVDGKQCLSVRSLLRQISQSTSSAWR